MDDREELFKAVFGESSDSEDDRNQREDQEEHRLAVDSPDYNRSQPNLTQNHEPVWEQVREITGLWLCRNFLSPQQQSSLLAAVQEEGWFTEESHNQAMRFGDLPPWATELSKLIVKAVLWGNLDMVSSDSEDMISIFPSALLRREPLFDQLIVNLYQPGEGIRAHVDLMRFEDGIAIVSLESSCVMHFSRVGEECENDIVVEQAAGNGPATAKIPVYLTAGSLVVMSGEARYLWKHEINRKPGFQIWKGQELHQKQRISITLRKLCQFE